jgi:DNA-binding beta-propeller fold protein YncE
MESTIRTVLLASVALLLSVPSASAGSFVYVAVPGDGCDVLEPRSALKIAVIDAETLGIVTSLPIASNVRLLSLSVTPDGRVLYVVTKTVSCADGLETGTTGTLITPIDLRRHVPSDSVSYGISYAQRAAALNEGRLYMARRSGDQPVLTLLRPGDLTEESVPLPDDGVNVAVNPDLNRVFVTTGAPTGPTNCGGQVLAFDADTLAQVGQHELAAGPVALLQLQDNQRLYALSSNPCNKGELSVFVQILDAPTLSSIGGSSHSWFINPYELPGRDEVIANRLGEVLRVPFTGGPFFPEPFPLPSPGDGVSSVTAPGLTGRWFTARLGVVSAFDLSTNAFIGSVDVESGRWLGASASTPAGAQTCSYRLDPRYASWSLTGGSGTVRLTTGCAWQAGSDSPWARVSTTDGDGNATITIEVDPSDLPTLRTATLTIGGQLVTVTQAGWSIQPPFGAFETPQDGASISGSVAVSGWALDDVGVARVGIYRDPVAGESDTLVYVGDATFVEGARPDVQAYLPDAPFAPRAGWGLMLLTNMLPNGGNGMFRLHAFAEDVEGNQALLGTHTLFVDNASAGLPFGAIDTPGQGETVSGTITNWGWALTPGSGFTIPVDGSTIDVVIDGVVVGHPTYGLFRADIAALFPGYTNSDGAVGHFTIDTTTLSNGMHSIAWVVRDSAGRAAGIGSRFFHVFNPEGVGFYRSAAAVASNRGPALPLFAAFLSVVPADSASAFVYAAFPAPLCPSGGPCAPELHVYDAETAALVIRLALPVDTLPLDVAASPDGAYVYVSNAPTAGGVASMTIVDALRHRVVGSFPTGGEGFPGHAGVLAVSSDNSKVFIAASGITTGSLSVFDTTTRTVLQSVATAPFAQSIVTSATPGRVYVFFAPNPRVAGSPVLKSYDAASLEEMASVVGLHSHRPTGLARSRDGQRLYGLVLQYDQVNVFGLGPSRRFTYAAEPLVELWDFPAGGIAAAPVELPATNELLAIDDTMVKRYALDSDTSSTVAELPGRGTHLTVAPGDARAFVATERVLREPDGEPSGLDALVAVDLATGAVTPVAPARPSSITGTPAGVQACSYRVDSGYVSAPLPGGVYQLRLTTTCDWQATSDAEWARISTTAGEGTSTIDVTIAAHVLPTSRTATLTIGGRRVSVTQAGGVTQPPFGAFETPPDGASNISGSLAVTGWALDDVGVARVEIWRDPVEGEGASIIHLGDATFVEGARPDVQAFLPDAPFASRAGWGLMVLTNALPNGGNGMFRLHAFAQDVEGNQAVLGTHTLFVDNASASLPFGAIDTPGQGETVSGTIVNWGWALTPGSGFTIPPDGSTIDVLIDGLVVGHPAYGLFRADIAALFPGYTNSDGAVGYFTIDTTMLSNGMHSIAWVVRDSAGRAAGIGSRFFHVFNP